MYYYGVDKKRNRVGMALTEEHAMSVGQGHECEAGKLGRDDECCQWLYPSNWL